MSEKLADLLNKEEWEAFIRITVFKYNLMADYPAEYKADSELMGENDDDK